MENGVWEIECGLRKLVVDAGTTPDLVEAIQTAFKVWGTKAEEDAVELHIKLWPGRRA